MKHKNIIHRPITKPAYYTIYDVGDISEFRKSIKNITIKGGEKT